MSHKPMLICAAVVLLVYGLIWMVIPAVGLGLYGHTAAVHDLASIIACYWGSAFIGIDVILWLARNGQADSIAVRAIEMGGLVLSVTRLVAGIIDALFGNPNAMIWVTIMLYALFSVWFAVVALKKPV
jgi:hypothetical protein